MEAQQTTLRALLNGQQQYVVPLFQRTYNWKHEQWQTLWRDILELYDSEAESEHFLGSIVTLGQIGKGPELITPYIMIDGQQRMTTLCILLAAVRDAARATSPDLSTRTQALYLTNQLMTGLDRYKVLPTQADREAFFEVIESPREGGSTRIAQAYSYYLDLLREGGYQHPRKDQRQLPQDSVHDLVHDRLDHPDRVLRRAPDLPRFQNIVLDKLNLVSIKLAHSDNAYRIFESLNAKGMRLTQSDLLRNYFFMRLPATLHEKLYADVWRPMQDRLGSVGNQKNFESFIRDALVKDGDFTRNDEVYQGWKTRLDQVADASVPAEMEELAAHSVSYQRILYPDLEDLPKLAERVRRLNRWGGTTIYPFLLNVYRDVDSGRLDREGVAEIMTMIESYLVRRLFTNVPTNALNRIFIRLYRQLPASQSEVEATREALSAPGIRWPHDDEFADGILRYPLYLDSRPEQRKLILEQLEDAFDDKERVDFRPLEIEHIMPQTLTSEWRELLGPQAEDIHRRLVHTLGNLTLTGHNPELSNHPYQRKQQIYQRSRLAMNKEVADSPSWGEAEIVHRGRELALRATRIWPGPLVAAGTK